MKTLFIANWKSHKTVEESLNFLRELKEPLSAIDLSEKEVIILPQFIALSECVKLAKEENIPVSFGVQNVSDFSDGPYTGEVSARQASEFAKYALLNHSERRKYLNETDEDLRKKYEEAVKILTPIVCVQSVDSFIPDGAKFVAYEPPTAISTFGVGKPETKDEVVTAFNALKTKTDAVLIYGGSVTSQDIKEYKGVDSLAGFLIGAASLEVKSFVELLLQW